MHNSIAADNADQQEIQIIVPQDHFTRVSNQAIRDKRLKGNAFKILCWLASHAANFKTTYKSISEQMGLAQGTIASSFKMLEELGYLFQTKAKKKNGFNDASKKTINWCPPVDNSKIEANHTLKIEANHTSKIEACHTSKIEVHKNNKIQEEQERRGALAPNNDLFNDLSIEDRVRITRVKAKPYLYDLVANIVLNTPEKDANNFPIRGELAGLVKVLKDRDADLGNLNGALIIQRLKEDIAHHNALLQKGVYSPFKTIRAWLDDLGWSTDLYRQTPTQKNTQPSQADESRNRWLGMTEQEREAEREICRQQAAIRYQEEKKRGLYGARMETSQPREGGVRRMFAGDSFEGTCDPVGA